MGMFGAFKKMTEEEVERYRQGEELSYDQFDCDIDKSWEPIHYLLTGDIAAAYVIPLNEDVETLAEPRAIMSAILTPEQVREAAAGIAPIDEAAFIKLFDFKAMVEDELYPLSPDEDEKELYDYIWAHFRTLKTFYQEAEKAGNYVVFEIL